MSTALDPNDLQALRTVTRPDGTEVRLDDIATVAQGNELVDELDASIARLETQIYDHDTGIEVRSKAWRRQAAFDHRDRCRLRPRLQHRVGELRKAERRAAVALKSTEVELPGGPANSPKDGQRRAFVLAAEQLLDRHLITEIWARAQEMRPSAFADGGAS